MTLEYSGIKNRISKQTSPAGLDVIFEHETRRRIILLVKANYLRHFSGQSCVYIYMSMDFLFIYFCDDSLTWLTFRYSPSSNSGFRKRVHDFKILHHRIYHSFVRPVTAMHLRRNVCRTVRLVKFCATCQM